MPADIGSRTAKDLIKAGEVRDAEYCCASLITLCRAKHMICPIDANRNALSTSRRFGLLYPHQQTDLSVEVVFLMPPLLSESVEVDADVTGFRWSVAELDELAKLIAVIALGQAEHAARIIRAIESNGPALSHALLFVGARGQMKIRGTSAEQKKVSRYHRDGFLFECISWIMARQSADDRTFLKDPHISSTTQGLDGLQIQMHSTEPSVVRAIICEDKCSSAPRKKFSNQVIPAFNDHHEGRRSRELLANAITLIKESGMDGTSATQAASRVLELQYRTYRAALTVKSSCNTAAKLKKLFKGYSGLHSIGQAQRVGAVFPIDGNLREWFQNLADLIVTKLDEFEEADV